MIKDSLGDRMKAYEVVSKTRLVNRMPVIIRLDGKAFHTFTRGFRKPFDELLNKTMQETMKYLCENIQGCVLGYTQSDEITLVLIDYQNLNSSAWFDYEVLKLTSVSASLATYAFNKYFTKAVSELSNNLDLDKVLHPSTVTEKREKLVETYKKAASKGAYFDSRVFNIPKEEVTNCVYWRQLDAERNSVSSLAQSLFSHKSLQGLSTKKLIEKIETEKGIVWGNLPTTQKRGCCCVKVYEKVVGAKMDKNGLTEFTVPTTDAIRGIWTIDNDIPKFKDEGREYIEKLVFVGE